MRMTSIKNAELLVTRVGSVIVLDIHVKVEIANNEQFISDDKQWLGSSI